MNHPMDNTETQTLSEDLRLAQKSMLNLKERLQSVILGRDAVIDLILIALFADGHVLLEDYPGSGKTTLAKALGLSLSNHTSNADENPSAQALFRRIQFTPDLLPSDITGTTIFDVTTQTFQFRKGPIFAHVVLADEINRTSPKVQSAMLEAMAEKQVTVDNQTHPLTDPFFVIATQNPLDFAGTYPLPSPQLDRFLFKISMKHIAVEAERQLLHQYPQQRLLALENVPKITHQEVLLARNALRQKVEVAVPIKDALVDLARNIRADTRVLQGVSTRALLLALPALQAAALLRGRNFVLPEDLHMIAPHIFSHRIEASPGTEQAQQILSQHLQNTVQELAKISLRPVRT